jgi:predicted protein tyrosine phosphatase
VDKFRDLDLPRIKSLDVPDEYEFMEPELIDLIRTGVERHIGELN